MRWVWQQGQFRETDAIPLTDRGFRYGMSVFETIAIRRGMPMFFQEHLQRLAEACAQCRFPVPGESLERVKELFTKGCAEGVTRVYVTAGDGVPAAPVEKCRVVVFTEERTRKFSDTHPAGYSLGIDHRRHSQLFCGLKTGNYWANIAALATANEHGKDEAVLLNDRGEIISACTANLFAVFNGKIVTPHLGSGARNGVIREWVMKNRSVDERALTVGDLAQADEVFLTSSWLGIMTVTSLEDRVLPTKVTSSTLYDEFDSFLTQTCGQGT
jgi:4-amino-4-deoxychorismate lyase